MNHEIDLERVLRAHQNAITHHATSYEIALFAYVQAAANLVLESGKAHAENIEERYATGSALEMRTLRRLGSLAKRRIPSMTLDVDCAPLVEAYENARPLIIEASAQGAVDRDLESMREQMGLLAASHEKVLADTADILASEPPTRRLRDYILGALGYRSGIEKALRRDVTRVLEITRRQQEEHQRIRTTYIAKRRELLGTLGTLEALDGLGEAVALYDAGVQAAVTPTLTALRAMHDTLSDVGTDAASLVDARLASTESSGLDHLNSACSKRNVDIHYARQDLHNVIKSHGYVVRELQGGGIVECDGVVDLDEWLTDPTGVLQRQGYQAVLSARQPLAILGVPDEQLPGDRAPLERYISE